MKIKLSLIMSLMAFISSAQNFYYNQNFSYFNPSFQVYYIDQNTPIEHFFKQKFENVNYTFTYKNGKKSIYRKEYNSEGRLIKLSKSHNGKEFKTTNEYAYNGDNLIDNKSFKKGKLSILRKYTYNQNNKVISNINYNKKNEITFQSTIEYNNAGCTSKYSRLKGENKLKSYTIYEYYDECDRKKTTNYNSKNKVQSIVSYACKNEGEILVKKKKEKQMCNWDEVTPEYLIKITQSFDEKGRKTRIVEKFDIKDTILIEFSRYDYKNRLAYKKINEKYFNDSLNKYFPREVFTSYGSLKYTYKYSNDKLIEKTTMKKGKNLSKTEYKYDGGNLLEKTYYRKGKQLSKSEYSYHKNLLTGLNTYGKKNDLISSLVIEYGKELKN